MSYNQHQFDHLQHQHQHQQQQQQQQQQGGGYHPYIQQQTQTSLNYNDYNLETFENHSTRLVNDFANMNVDPSTSFAGIFDSPSTPTTNSSDNNNNNQQQQQQAMTGSSRLPSSSQPAPTTHPSSQQPHLLLTNNHSSSFQEANHSTSSLERLGIDTSSITNPALNSFFQLPFELQIQQFPLTNPPLFDFQQPQPYYQNFNGPHHDPNVLGSDQIQYGDLQFQQQQQQQQQLLLSFLNQETQGQISNNHQHQNPHLHMQQAHYYNSGQQVPSLRRRISISNGQIGQLVQFTQQQIQLLNPSYSPEAVLAAAAVLIQSNHSPVIATPGSTGSQQQQHPQSVGNSSQEPSPVNNLQQPHHVIESTSSQMNKLKESATLSPGDNLLQQQQPTQLPEASDNHNSSESSLDQQQQQHPSGLNTNANGVPKHQLLYNNEVIFNPNNGPIPGTSAWKKQKLLERNRIAASKCRQRKKQQQQRLVQDIDKYVRHNRNLSLKVKILEKKLFKFSKIMEVHFEKCHSGDNSFPLLKELINDTEEEFAKVKLEDNESDPYDIDGNLEDSDFLDNSGRGFDSDENADIDLDSSTTPMKT